MGIWHDGRRDEKQADKGRTMMLKEYLEDLNLRVITIYRNLIEEVMPAVMPPVVPRIEEIHRHTKRLFSSNLSFYIKERINENPCSVGVDVYCAHAISPPYEENTSFDHGYDVRVGDPLVTSGAVGLDIGHDFVSVDPEVIVVDASGEWFRQLQERMDHICDVIATGGPAIIEGLNNFSEYAGSGDPWPK